MGQPHSERRTIDIESLIEALEQPLELFDSEEKRAEIQRYLSLARLSLERALFDVISEAVQVVNEADGDLRARLEYEEGTLALVVEPTTPEDEEPATETLFSVDGDVEKVTIRLPSELKELVGEAATSRGVSVNTWYIRELAAAVRNAAAKAGREALDEMADEESHRPHHLRQHGGGSLRGVVGGD